MAASRTRLCIVNVALMCAYCPAMALSYSRIAISGSGRARHEAVGYAYLRLSTISLNCCTLTSAPSGAAKAALLKREQPSRRITLAELERQLGMVRSHGDLKLKLRAIVPSHYSILWTSMLLHPGIERSCRSSCRHPSG
jgi:hypothetical protein